MLIKNLINDMYAKDIGYKVKTSKRLNAKQGFFIGSNPPFGYKVVKKDGLIIFSGIIEDKCEILKKEIEALGFEILEIKADKEWRAMLIKAN